MHILRLGIEDKLRNLEQLIPLSAEQETEAVSLLYPPPSAPAWTRVR